MGLDTVELVMEFEDDFDIQISDQDVQRFATPATVIDHIFAAVRDRECDPVEFATRNMFYELRDSMQKSTGHGDRIRPSTELAEAIPWADRMNTWKALSHDLGIALPKLQLPREAWILSAWILLTGAMFVGFVFESVILGIVSPLALIPAFMIASSPLARNIPTHVGSTFGEFAKFLVKIRYGAQPPRGGWTREAVAKHVREIIRGQLGIQEFDDEDRFVEDMGAH